MTTAVKGLRDMVDEAVAASGVAAASVAVYQHGDVHAAAAGMANVHTGVPATVDTVFLIGSITKSFTATLAMQQIEAGALSLDHNLADALPELEFEEPGCADRITIRHLLSHTSGIDGDLLIDTGRDDDCYEKFVEACGPVRLVHEPGAFFSYCNTGYILLGRILEKLTETGWDDLLRERIFEPLEMAHAGTRLEDLVLRRFAAGHTPNDEGGYDLEPMWVRSNSPSGSRAYMTASELVTFASVHLRGGTGPGDARLLDASSVSAMQARAVEIPLSPRYRAWGLGWMIFDWSGRSVFGHDGGVAGTSSFLRILPEQDLAIALTTTGAGYHEVFRRVMGRLLEDLGGIGSLPEIPDAIAAHGLDLTRYAGRYERHGLDIELTVEDGKLMGAPGGDYGDPDAVPFEIQCIDRKRFRGRIPGIDVDVGIYFLDFDADSGRPRYLHYLERAFRRFD